MSNPNGTDYHQLAAQLTPSDRAAMTAGRNGWATPAHPAAGLGELTMLDGPMGIVSKHMDERETSTLLPSATALAASWDPALVSRVAQVVGAEARDTDTQALLAPNLGLPLSPLSGRSFEMYSEDPWLSGTFGAAFVAGLQSQGVAACIKHLAGNDTETKRQLMNAVIGEKTLREINLLPFEMAVEAGAWMAMAAYNRVNGVPSVEQSHVLGIVKDEWDFDGVIVSDWFATKRTAETANAGVDLEMPGPARFLGQAVADAVAVGDVTDGRLTDMAARFLKLAARVGLPDSAALPEVTRHDAVEVLRAAAAAGSVLLTNNDEILPLSVEQGTRIAVIGPNAAVPCYQGGTFARVTIDPALRTPLQVLRREFAHAEIRYEPGTIVEGISGLGGLNPIAPDGTPGVLVEYFTGADPDRAAYSEVRPGSSFVWFNDIPGIGGPGDRGRVRLTATVTAAIAGTYRLCVGGTGDATLSMDGRELVQWPAPELSDVMGVVAQADTAGADVELAAGQRFTVAAEAAFTPGRVQSITAGYYAPTPPDLLGAAEAAARDSDLVVLFVGDNTSSSRESADRDNTSLGAVQVELIERVAAANPRTVVVVNASRSVDMPWVDRVSAVLMVWYPGQEFGAALADVLLGRRSPGGRLPITIAMRDEDYAGHGVTLDDELNLDYELIKPGGFGHLERTGKAARFPFGFGLTYTWFRHENPTLNVDIETKMATVTVSVQNCGDRPGREVVQVYGRAPGEDHSRLIGFGAVELAPGAQGDITIDLPARAFSRWDESTNKWSVPSGEHVIRIGRSAEDVLAAQTVTFFR
jgi:beta-glucosidase